MPPSRQLTPDWRETARLRDGSEVHLRLVRPEDKRLFVEAFDRLSPNSRYRRFLTAKRSLSERDLRYLTELDGENHLALGASRGDGEGEQGLGVARFVRCRDQPAVAEAAVVVTDDAQGMGLGQLLLAWLVVAARERGVTEFRCPVMADNAPVLSLLREHVPAAKVTPRDDGTVEVRLELSSVPSPAQPAKRGEGTRSLLRLVARDILQVAQRLEALGERLLPHARHGQRATGE